MLKRKKNCSWVMAHCLNKRDFKNRVSCVKLVAIILRFFVDFRVKIFIL